MANFFRSYPEFIETDVRKDRTDVSYRVTDHLMDIRHRFMMPAETLARRTVLDLGCCVAATGAWCLHHRAKRYVGVELDKGFADQATANLSNRFPHSDWSIECTDILQFLSSNDKKFDIVMASGIIYAIMDVHGFLEKLSKIAGTIIIESVHPMDDWRDVLSKSLPPERADELIEQIDPTWMFEQFSIMRTRRNYMVKGQSGTYYEDSFGTYPSMASLDMIMNRLGFADDRRLYKNLKQAYPDLYGRKRFAMRFDKGRATKNIDTVNELYLSSGQSD